MDNILVSLIGNQTIPNVLFIGEMKNKITKYIFISTEQMENNGKTDSVIDASHIDRSKVDRIEVVEDSIEDITHKLEKFAKENLRNEEKIILNLTGGTKIMSIGAYDFFKNRNTIMYYLPIGKNVYKQISSSKENKLNFRISLNDYLVSYGIKSNAGNLLKNKEDTKNLFDIYLNNEFDTNVLNNLRKKRNEREIKIDKEIEHFLKDIEFKPSKKGTLSRKEIQYLTGGWFEEYVYILVKENIQLNDNKIGLSVQISRNKTPNEFDVMFVHKNTLYIIECKTSLKDGERNLLNDTLYKLSALKKEFGLSVKSYLFTLDKNLRNNNREIKIDYQKRAGLLDINLVDRVILNNKPELNKLFNKIKGD